MSGYRLHRILGILPLLWVVSSLVFLLGQLLPGDPVDLLLGDDASLVERERLRRIHHLHLPLLFNAWPLQSSHELEKLLSRCSLETTPSDQPSATVSDLRSTLLEGAEAVRERLYRLGTAGPTLQLRACALDLLADALLKPELRIPASSSPEQLERIGHEWQRLAPALELNVEPGWGEKLARVLGATRYAHFYSDLLSGQLTSRSSGGRVVDLILTRLPYTLELALAALLISLLVAIPLGTWAAWKPGTGIDQLGRLLALLSISTPNFWIGPVLILLFAIELNWLPVSGASARGSLVLPALTLGLGMSGTLARVTRASVMETLNEDYVRAARARGASAARVLVAHALRGALLPVVTLLGLQLGTLLSGAVITEEIFGWPGLGRELIGAIRTRDLPLLEGCVLVITLTYTLVNTGTDLLYARLDPRVRLGESRSSGRS